MRIDGLEGGEVAARNRRLQEGGAVGGRDQAPRLVVGPLRGQAAQQRRPLAFVGGGSSAPGPVQRHGRELDEEGVPRVALVRPQRRELGNAILGQQGQTCGREQPIRSPPVVRTRISGSVSRFSMSRSP